MSKTPTPNSFWFNTNKSCNLRCGWCYAANSEYLTKDKMSFETATKLLMLAKDLGAKNILLIGGEPTLWNPLFEFNDLCRNEGIRTTLVTNSLRFSDDAYWEEYLEHPNDAASLSFKDYDPNRFFKNTRVNVFDKVDKGLKRIFEHFKQGLNFAYTKSTQGHMIDMVKYAVNLGAKAISIGYCTPTIYKDHVDPSHMVDTEIMIRETVESYEEINRLVCGSVVYSLKHPLCIWPSDFLKTIVEKNQVMTTCHLQHRLGGLFDTDGSLLMCNSLSDFAIGKYGVDFDSSDSFLKFIGSDKINGFYERLLCYPSVKCMDCSMYENCVGGCPLLWTVLDPNQVITGPLK